MPGPRNGELAGGIEKAKLHLATLESNFEKLMGMRPIRVGGPLPADVPKCGIYLFSKDGKFLYVGRTDNLKRRLSYHYGRGSDSNAASFAFLLAREASGMLTDKRTACMSEERFRLEFDKAKALIRQMELRYFEETDPVGQALLEIFTAVATGAKHNSFKNH